jgi:hypothetical protein
VDPGKSDSLLCGKKELDFFLQPPAFSGAWLTFGQVEGVYGLRPGKNVGKAEEIYR